MNRKELKNTYKETVQPMGIYQIRNTATGKILLGSSLNLPAIINRHRFQLQNGLHMNRQLQRDFVELGEQGIAFEILDTLKPREDARGDYAEDLSMLEEMWRDKLRSTLAEGYDRG